MIELRVDEIATAISGRIVGSADAAGVVVGGTVQTDSREVSPGALFFALPGEFSDGHVFASAAVEAGAVLLVVERELDVAVPQIVVANGLLALSALAREVVARVRARGELRGVHRGRGIHV